MKIDELSEEIKLLTEDVAARDNRIDKLNEVGSASCYGVRVIITQGHM